uniref:hypothetical protein n=1 Tax=Alistipes sp. TaxID=1872444 RepID=UPI00405771AE
MKTRNLLFAAFLFAFGAASCENVVETPVTPDEEAKTYTVHFNLGGELNISQNPLTRISLDDRDLIAINVYNREFHFNNRYAYGLFDNLADAKIDLLADQQYAFEVLLIDDGKDKIYRDSVVINERVYYGYKKPFDVGHEVDGQTVRILDVMNEFSYSNQNYFRIGYYSDPTFTLLDNKDYYNPADMNLFYGSSIFTPTADNEHIDVVMKHIIYGLRIEVGDFFNEGVITAKLHNNSQINTFELTPENKVVEQTYAYNHTDNWANQTDLSEAKVTYGIEFTWKKEDGSQVVWKRQDVQFNRLKETIVKLEMYEMPGNYYDLQMIFEDLPIEKGYQNFVIGDDWEDYNW